MQFLIFPQTTKLINASVGEVIVTQRTTEEHSAKD